MSPVAIFVKAFVNHTNTQHRAKLQVNEHVFHSNAMQAHRGNQTTTMLCSSGSKALTLV